MSTTLLLITAFSSDLVADDNAGQLPFRTVPIAFLGPVDTRYSLDDWHWMDVAGRRLPVKVDLNGKGWAHELDSTIGTTPSNVRIHDGELFIEWKGRTYRHAPFGHYELRKLAGLPFVHCGPVWIQDGEWVEVKANELVPAAPPVWLDGTIEIIPEDDREWEPVPQREQGPILAPVAERLHERA